VKSKQTLLKIDDEEEDDDYIDYNDAENSFIDPGLYID